MNKSNRGLRLTESQFGFLLLFPALIVYAAVLLYPLLNSTYMSFTDQTLLKADRHFVGLANFRALWHDPNFLDMFLHTVAFVVGATIAPFILGFIWSIVLQQGFKGSKWLRSLTLVNWVLPGTAISFLWMWMFQSNYGVINGLLMKLGLISENINWLGSTNYAMAVVILASTWKGVPWFMVFLFGGLQAVPREQLEAARMDGAGNVTAFLKIIYPSMRPIIAVSLILGAIGNLQQFDLQWVMTEGGPARATTTLSIEVYRSAFREWDLGKASAIGLVWVLIMGIFAAFYLRHMREQLKS
ncbi:carbohydrate ABC transporter permease [Paenibacillus glycinis]|uniref:ABC transporter permease subunit n=1 Tax=Paenibacillus glycinis TaxID=2697035 RepID=A0ABW9XSQ9_9BACL|nr:sugar ABC transporter permease [Paenibacillus glycinis]NBD25711.1 ABC transporter permease subunit [Paenibacillus glycinis]